MMRSYASDVQQNGALNMVPGLLDEDRGMDQMPMMLTGRAALTLSSGSSTVSLGMVPFDAGIISVNILYPTAPDADTSIDIGNTGDANAYGDHTAVAADLSNGDLEQDVSLDSVSVSAGDNLQIATDGAASSGTAWVSVILAPKA